MVFFPLSIEENASSGISAICMLGGWNSSSVCQARGSPTEVWIKSTGLVRQSEDMIKARKEILIDQRKQLLTKMVEIQKIIYLVNINQKFIKIFV
jgi:hypothetical protein